MQAVVANRNVMYNNEHSVNGWTVIRDRPSSVESEEIDRQSSYEQSYRSASPYTLPPLTTTTTSSTRGSPVHLSLPIPPSLPFPSSKSPVSAPPHPHALPHDILHPYHPSSAHPSSAYSRERDSEREREFERYAAHHSSSIPLHHHAHHTRLPPLEVPAHPHSTHSPTSALASSTSKLTVNSLLSSKPSPPPSHLQHPHGLPPPPPHHHPLSHHHPGSHYPLTTSGPSCSPSNNVPPDATTKLSSYIRRRCFNCHTPDSAAWRRSSMHPGKVLCNKCGLYERTHQKDRPHDPAELRSKPRKTTGSIPSSLLTTNPNPSSTVQPKLSGPGVVGVDPVPPRPLNHGSLLNIHGSAPSSSAASPITNSPIDRGADRNSAHSLGALLNHHQNHPDSQTHSPGHNSNVMRLPSLSPGSKPTHLSPSGYTSPHPNSPHISSRSALDQRDRERDSYPSPRHNYSHPYSPREPYRDDVKRSPIDERERERERERREDRERRENEEVRDSSR
ncbi:hypothetical protein Clacol_005093 [Clathrus columnatus]|uniref:GATA-type domain-containing protein n=1 Tax=Clathrus columnatus TaxID=1419009 RepID=A0AAV5AD72_9AGAM|nr:hypothetical protein Clacol_005093 [Clathrus columnatus]